MDLVQAIQAMQWVDVLALLLAVALAIDVHRLARDRASLLLAMGLTLGLLGWIAVASYAGTLRLIFSLADPRTVFPWYLLADGLFWISQGVSIAGYLLLAGTVFVLGQRYTSGVRR